ncbi:MAG: division/cell wall cluster transcriptional repressor MraZ [Parasporobacterium sp.]|nr:division/cell wall cluster transcriptional repressor MraZ [Parasporobacterium sp.]
MFMGEYNHTIDAKGRAIIPVKFREPLGSKFVVTKGLDHCLWVYPEEQWRAFYEQINSLPASNPNNRKIQRFFGGSANESELDKQGRVLIPQTLREHAYLEKDITVVGLANRIEIWDTEHWKEASTFDNIDEIAAQMDDWGFGI